MFKKETRNPTLQDITGRIVTYSSMANSMLGIVNELHKTFVGPPKLGSGNSGDNCKEALPVPKGFISETVSSLDEIGLKFEMLSKKLAELAEVCLPHAVPRTPLREGEK